MSIKNNCNKQDTCTIENNPNNKIKNIIGVMSGKGGVGKSTITSLIAKQLSKSGYKVGILDADITGPSIPRLMGVQYERAFSNNGTDIYPIITKENIKTMSVNFMVNDESQPVVWKGPLISNTIKQFYKDVMWEELRLFINRYATRNRRCSSYSYAIFAFDWNDNGICTTRHDIYDSFERC